MSTYKQIINSEDAPAPIGPYSQAVQAGNFIFLSGQIAIDPLTGELIQDSLQAETNQVMKNIQAVLKEAGLEMGSIVKTSIFLTDMKYFQEVNEVYASWFTTDFPARETVQVSGLPKGVRVEISTIALIK